jgi:shikimate dehydrogenase
MPLLDRLAPTAERAGAVNTVVIEDGSLIGHNTDLHGVEMTFEENGVDPAGKGALLIGAGGAARACCAFLSGAGARVSILNRTRSRAEELARSFGGCRAIDPRSVPEGEFDIIVNCTPLGMKGFPGELPLPADALGPGKFVMDAVYNPPMTPLLEEARRAGAAIANGERMLVHQALEAFRIWTGRTSSYDVMSGALRGGEG